MPIIGFVDMQVTVTADMSAVSVRWTARGDSMDKEIAALLPTFASQLRSVTLSVQCLFDLQSVSQYQYLPAGGGI